MPAWSHSQATPARSHSQATLVQSHSQATPAWSHSQATPAWSHSQTTAIHTHRQFESPLVYTSQLLTEAVSSMTLVHPAGSRDVQHPTQECFDDHIFHTHHQAWRKRRNLLSQTKTRYTDQRQMTNKSIRTYLQCPFLPLGGISTWHSYSTCSRSPPLQGRHICMQPSMLHCVTPCNTLNMASCSNSPQPQTLSHL